MVVVVMVPRLVVVRFDQTGHTGLFKRHSTTGFAVMAAAVGPTFTTAPPDVGSDGARALQRAYAAPEQVPNDRSCSSNRRSSRLRCHS